jgi:hypothetical protein
MPKVKQIQPYSEEWEKEAGRLARDFAPTIYPCKKCNHPFVNGYCCTFCGDRNPTESPKGESNDHAN